MLVKFLRLTLSGVVGLAFAASALADHHGGPHFGVQYRAGLTYDDNGLDDYDGNPSDPTSETSIDLEAAKVTAHGDAAKDVKYVFRYNALNNSVELASATWMHSSMFSLEIGRAKINQGGYVNKMSGYKSITPENFYQSYKPFSSFADVIALHLALAGKLTLQLTNDVVADTTTTTTTVDGVSTTTTTSDSGYKNTKNRGPAATLQWMGDFSGWMPLVQVASYDLNNSVFFVVGVKGKVAGLGLLLDYVNDSRKWFQRDGGNLTNKDVTDTYTAVNFKVDYAIGTWTPFLEYNFFDVEQGTNSEIAARTSDPEANPAATNKAWSDNGQVIAAGAVCNSFSKGYQPYLTIAHKQGKFFKANSTDTEDLSNMMLKVGVRGQF